jgi:hypothetical protein
VPWRLFFATQQRIAIEGSSNIKKSAVPRGENIRKKKGEKSSNFGEIIKKLHFLVWWKARQRATHANPHPSASSYRTFYTWRAASAIRRYDIYSRDSLAGGGGEGGVICETMPFVNESSD